MAYVKLSNGSVHEVDDDELRGLVLAGAEEVDGPQSSGYAYSSPEQYQDLYNNAKSVGYSGLDAAQKKLFDEAYPQSLYAKQGRSLEEAHQATDRAAGVGQGNFIQDANAGLTAGVQNMVKFLANQKDQSGVNPKAVGYEATPANWGKAAVNTAAFLVPIGVDAAIAKSLYNPLVKGLGSGLANAGIEYAREKANGEDGNPFAVGTAGLFGGLGGAGGGYLAGKAEATRLGEIAEKADLANRTAKQSELVSRLEGGRPLPGTQTLMSPYGNETWESYLSRSPVSRFTSPQERLMATKEHIASVEYGNKVHPDMISDMEAAKYLQMQEDNLRALQNTKVTRSDLIENPYDKLSSADVKSLINKGISGGIVEYPISLVNRHQDLVGNLGAFVPGAFASFGAQAADR